MISATRRWLKRNRTNFAIGFGVLGVGYVAGQYAINKISEARERMSSDRVAKEKYATLSPLALADEAHAILAYGDDSNKTKKIAHSPC